MFYHHVRTTLKRASFDSTVIGNKTSDSRIDHTGTLRAQGIPFAVGRTAGGIQRSMDVINEAGPKPWLRVLRQSGSVRERPYHLMAGMKVERRDPPKASDRGGDNLSYKDVKSNSFPASDEAFRGVEVKTATLRSRTKPVGEAGAQVAASSSTVSSVSLPRSLLNRSIAPILSIKRVGLTGGSTGQFLVFLLKLAALEAVRRGTKGRCPQIWWGLQGISLFQAPPFSWFQRFRPVRELVKGTQSFSKPLFVLSIATAVTDAIEEVKQASRPNLLERVLVDEAPRADVRAVETKRQQTLNRLRRELATAEVEVPPRINDDELERFLIAANGNPAKFVTIVRKTVSWRETYYFLKEQELRAWSPLIFWHDYDNKSRPVLVIRLGLAYRTLQPEDRPRFCQAVVSQVENGILNLLHEDDPRITVILDCEGTTCVGFPVAMMKSCSVLVQEHFPTRLAALYAVNLPPVVRVIAHAVMQVVRPVTREKVSLLGEVFLGSLSESLGGTEKVPAYMGGTCHCERCLEYHKSESLPQVSPFRGTLGRTRVQEEEAQIEEQDEAAEESAYQEDRVTVDYQSYNAGLRMAIIGLLMLWIVITMVAAKQEPQLIPS
ncbi:hypothetical protein R1sor_020328 [Riccia sorocarpa]|uniref:CRAL-TRIO domain-containing protein n=1 Tax=Riccia sorocarpa TaxID=122646 RepID=A0ABD3IFS1_9MARC